MKPQQLLNEALSFDPARLGQALQDHLRCARTSLPTLTAIAVAIASSIVLTLSGCASSAGIASKAQPVAPASVGLDAGATAATAPAVAADWWKGFGDSTLDDIVGRALAGNPGLKVAQARLERAQAAVELNQSADGLHVNGELDATRQRFSANSIYPPPLGGSIRTLGNAQIGASYEFDFFGKNRAAIEAAVGTQRAAQADVQAARIMLAGNVARTYVQLGRLFAQREVAERSLKQRDEILALIKQRVSGGLDTNVELRQGEGALPESRQQIEQLDEQIALTRHALAALTAQAPSAYDTLVVPLRAVQAVPVPGALPADLLGRRADISAARWRIEAATGDVRNAKASFYPNINLTAFVGLASIGLNNLVKASSEQYGFGPALTLPIFDGGRLRANLRGKNADLDAAIESYNGAVIDAVHDAADQISSVRSVERQQAQQANALAAAESAYDLATQRYKAGLGTYLTVLNAEAGVLSQRRLGADLKARALEVQIGLIRALGGGYAEASTRTAAAGQ
jgi:NodT family efflux transporter outer membrane factor (OMF) lipoprotein